MEVDCERPARPQGVTDTVEQPVQRLVGPTTSMVSGLRLAVVAGIAAWNLLVFLPA